MNRSGRSAGPFDYDRDGILDQAHVEQIGGRLKELRRHHLSIRSQREFAGRLGLSRGAVANWEIGKSISRQNLWRVSRVYKVSLYWLMHGKGPWQSTALDEIDALTLAIRQARLTDEERRDFLKIVCSHFTLFVQQCERRRARRKSSQ